MKHLLTLILRLALVALSLLVGCTGSVRYTRPGENLAWDVTLHPMQADATPVAAGAAK